MSCDHEEPNTTLSALPPPPPPPPEQRRAGEDEDEEEDEEMGEEEVRREVEEGSVEKGSTEASLLSSSPLPVSVMGRRKAQRERLNKILQDLLDRNPSKNGERQRTINQEEAEGRKKLY